MQLSTIPCEAVHVNANYLLFHFQFFCIIIRSRAIIYQEDA